MQLCLIFLRVSSLRGVQYLGSPRESTQRHMQLVLSNDFLRDRFVELRGGDTLHG